MQQQDPTHPTGVATTDPRGGSAVARSRERKAHAALQMRIMSASWDEIAEVLGYPSGHHALVATEKALEKELKSEESQSFLRDLTAKRLDRLLRAVMPKAVDPNDPDQFAAVEASRKVISDFRKLKGLDAPQEYVVSNPTAAEIERWVSTVAAAGTQEVQEADIFDVEVTSVEVTSAVSS